MQFRSHENKKLMDHLYEVCQFSEELMKEVHLKKEEKDQELLLTLSFINGIGHDFGKYTSFFQDHLETKKGGVKSHHSFISAIFTAHLATKICTDHQSRVASFAAFLCYMSVLHHHGNLKALEHVVLRHDDEEHDYFTRIETMRIQIEDMRTNIDLIQHELSELGRLCSIHMPEDIVASFMDDWPQTMKAIKQCQRKLVKLRRKQDPFLTELFFLHQMLYSVLIDSDKYSASNTKRTDRKMIPADIVDIYRRNEFDVALESGMNGWRNRMYNIACSNGSRLNEPIATLTAPTGSGKTLMAYSIALQLRKREMEQGRTPRIIYALPFTSVIDQNHEQAEKIFERYIDGFQQHEESLLLKHHHLAEIKYHDDTERPVHEALLLTESWESEFIVTTYVQLFETLIGWKNRSLKKFSKLTNSIIVLDEIQNIKAEYWPLLRDVFRTFVNVFHCKIILMTATQPLIFEEDETTELLESTEYSRADFFNSMDRVDLTYIPNPNNRDGAYDIDEWFQYFTTHYDDGNHYLAIFNTISTSIDLYKKIKKWATSQKTAPQIVYLSTNIVPTERRRRIQEIRTLMEDYQVIVISTQVIEAGVDLDFDVVYRDIGPIDSIIQAAGRCNRNGAKNRGQVYILPIRRDNNQDEARLVYGQAHISISEELLPRERTSESDFLEFVAKYFQLVKRHISKDLSRELWQAIKKYHFHGDLNNETYISDFQLINEKDYKYVDVFFETDEEAQSLWERYMDNVFEEDNEEERFKKHLRLKKEIRKYIISAPLKYFLDYVKSQVDVYERLHLLHVPYHNLSQYYDLEYGVIRAQSDVGVWTM